MDVLCVTDVHSVVTSLMYFRLPPAQKPSLLYSTVGGAIGQIIPIPSLSVSQMAVRLQRRVEEVLNGNEPVEGSLVPSYVPTGLETLRCRESLMGISVRSMRIYVSPHKRGSRRNVE